MKRVLFVCVGNSARSVMAEALFNHLAQGRALATSAGTRPSSAVAATAVAVMAELGIDIRSHRPQLLTQEMLDGADRIITMGCGVEETCPAGFVASQDWGLDDPRGQPLDKVREIRDQIRAKVEALLRELECG